jgi:LysR family transcriptional activator of nhaA
VAECDDSALVKSLGKAKVGLFVAPGITRAEIMKQYNVREVGRLDGVVERYYAVLMDRRIKHPAVQAIVDHAKDSVFGEQGSLT